MKSAAKVIKSYEPTKLFGKKMHRKFYVGIHNDKEISSYAALLEIGTA